MSFTPNQKTTLLHMFFHDGRMYADRWERTLVSLERHKLVKYTHGRKYGKGGWRLTPAGTLKAADVAARIQTNHMNLAEQVRVLGANSLLPR
jgi:hypothetical protein